MTAAARGWADAVGVMAGPPDSVVSGKFPANALCLKSTFPDACYLNTALATKGPVFSTQVPPQKGYGLCQDEKFAQETVLRATDTCTVFRLPQTSAGEAPHHRRRLELQTNPAERQPVGCCPRTIDSPTSPQRVTREVQCLGAPLE